MPLSPTPNYPGSLDALPDPTTTTYTDDDGFELDLLLQKHNAILEALEGKVGVVASTPVRRTTLYGFDANGQTIWDRVARRNRLYNGSMRVNQRVTMPTADNAYFLDRWRMLLGAAGACTPSQELTDTPAGGSHRAAKLAVTATNNNKFGMFQPLEGIDVYDLRGQTVSLSFWAKVSNARIGDMRAAVLQWTGTEDAISATPITTWGNEGAGITTFAGSWAAANAPANLSPTTAWAQYIVENITISASATNVGILIWSDDKTTTNGDFLLVTDVQLERGAIVTDFDYARPLVEDLMRCQRYYEKSYGQTFAPGNASALGEVIGPANPAIAASTAGSLLQPAHSAFRVEKRVTPTVVVYASGSGTANAVRVGGSADRGGCTAGTPSTTRPLSYVAVDNSSATAIALSAQIQYHWTADAEL